jgi:N-acetylmuramoyl-L-alanine amidase
LKRVAGFLLAALASAAAAAGPGAARAADVERLEGEVATPDLPEPRELSVVRIDEVDYLDVEEIAFLFRAARVFKADLGRVELTVAEKKIAIVAGSPFAEVNGSTANLGAPVAWVDGRLVAPVRLATHVLDPLVRERVSWSEEQRFLRFDRSDPNVTGITYSAVSGGTAVEIKTARELPGVVSTSQTKKGREVLLRIPGGVLTDKLTGTLAGNGVVESLTTAQSPGSAALSFRLKSAGVGLRSARHEGPTRIVLRFGSEDAADPGAPADSLLELDEAFSFEPEERGFAIRRVVIDPGHGGSDAGGSSPRGDREKDVALAIARRVRSALLERAPDLDVLLTREDDRYVVNEERRRFANDAGADLFLSIHCDAWFDEKRRGFSLTTWGRGGADEGRSLPPSAVRVEMPRDTERLAETVAHEMDRALTVPNRGVVHAELDVLEGLNMPGLLIECGTLTNADDRKQLLSESFQEKAADAIAEGVLEYRATLGVPEDEPLPDEEEDERGDDEETES